MLSFLELAPFTKAREAYGMEDEEFGDLQIYLAEHPRAGAVIPGSDGCRKMRWSGAGRGKRGGLRIIYFLRLTHGQIVLVLLYGKNVRENVKPQLLKQLREAFEYDEDER